MQRCLFLSSTSLVLLAGCPNDPKVCGAGDAPADGVTATEGAREVTYGNFRASANNDCPMPGAPDGVISVTIAAEQVAPAGDAVFSLCIPRPDLIDEGTAYPLIHQPIQNSEQVQLEDLEAAPEADCRWAINADTSAIARFAGFCDDGVHADGFAVTLSGTVDVVETCGAGAPASITVELDGTVAVLPL